MTAIAEPPPRTSSAVTRARRSKPRPLSAEELARRRARYRRKEIISLIAFCVVLAIVFVTRN